MNVFIRENPCLSVAKRKKPATEKSRVKMCLKKSVYKT
jgi:hypothetical protein